MEIHLHPPVRIPTITHNLSRFRGDEENDDQPAGTDIEVVSVNLYAEPTELALLRAYQTPNGDDVWVRFRTRTDRTLYSFNLRELADHEAQRIIKSVMYAVGRLSNATR